MNADREGAGRPADERQDPAVDGGGRKVSELELELGRCGQLVGEIVDGRRDGNFDSLAGCSDDDLLAAVEEIEGAIKDWRSQQ